jgi:hypothetical protein
MSGVEMTQHSNLKRHREEVSALFSSVMKNHADPAEISPYPQMLMNVLLNNVM